MFTYCKVPVEMISILLDSRVFEVVAGLSSHLTIGVDSGNYVTIRHGSVVARATHHAKGVC
jgi:hypothetical protein